ncbi:hypothetical protein [Halopiger xanaduensis]|uniref:Lipoprotein n=1 Tax=Halopiger xanaduensis (strain DSM 18323 / JCM 14033 / SH-6) TaxID=797210 RepID=F8D5Y7_HALXS|nr:hypothetical protein [Halopiger xanaduensis]AEH37715.1 hypothetical protein Halxa_3101 [Halopiger xanaduensis SH-6]
MTPPTSRSTLSRRAVLLGGAGTLALSAGCIQDSNDSNDDANPADPDSGSSGSDNESDGGNESDGENESEDDSGTDGSDDNSFEYETHLYQYPDTPTEPDASLFVTQDGAENWLANRELEEDPVAEFVADTTFDDSVLVPLEADAPSHCYEMVLESIDVIDGDGDDVLEIEAAVRDVSGETEYCAQAKTTVGLLVRATFESAPVTEISVRIVDDDGNEHGIGAGHDTATGTESDTADGGNETESASENETESDDA